MKGDEEMNPKKWWFAIPLPAALLFSYMIWAGRQWVGAGFEEVLESFVITVTLGLMCFPIGLPEALSVPEDIMELYYGVFVFSGYALYLTLSVAGMLKPTRYILLALAVLLILNIAGCQMEGTINAIPL
jgi:hypothetical protein